MNQHPQHIKEQLEEVIKKNLPEDKITQCNYSTSDIRMLSSTDIEMEKNKGFNQALSQINISLIADEVLKVVRMEIEKYKWDTDISKYKNFSKGTIITRHNKDINNILSIYD